MYATLGRSLKVRLRSLTEYPYVDYGTNTSKDWSGIHIYLSYFENSSIQSGEFRLRGNSDFTNRDINPSNTFMSSRYDLSKSYERIFPEN